MLIINTDNINIKHALGSYLLKALTLLLQNYINTLPKLSVYPTSVQNDCLKKSPLKTLYSSSNKWPVFNTWKTLKER